MFRTINFYVFRAFLRIAVTPMHQACLQKERSFTSHPTQSVLSLKDSPHMRQQLLSADSPSRADSVIWMLISVVAVAFIEEDIDEKAEYGECDDEEEADDKMGVIARVWVVEAVDEEEEDDTGIEASIVGTYSYIHV